MQHRTASLRESHRVMRRTRMQTLLVLVDEWSSCRRDEELWRRKSGCRQVRADELWRYCFCEACGLVGCEFGFQSYLGKAVRAIVSLDVYGTRTSICSHLDACEHCSSSYHEIFDCIVRRKFCLSPHDCVLQSTSDAAVNVSAQPADGSAGIGRHATTVHLGSVGPVQVQTHDKNLRLSLCHCPSLSLCLSLCLVTLYCINDVMIYLYH
jgi:hypothetical protein